MDRPLDLSVFKRDGCAIDDHPKPYVKIEMANNQNVDGINMIRVGIDMFAVPTLLRRWATVIEGQLVRPGETPEMIVEEEGDGQNEAGGAPLRHGQLELGGGQNEALG